MKKKEENHQREATRSQILPKVHCTYLVQQLLLQVEIVAWKILKMLNQRAFRLGEIKISINLKIKNQFLDFSFCYLRFTSLLLLVVVNENNNYRKDI